MTDEIKSMAKLLEDHRQAHNELKDFLREKLGTNLNSLVKVVNKTLNPRLEIMVSSPDLFKKLMALSIKGFRKKAYGILEQEDITAGIRLYKKVTERFDDIQEGKKDPVVSMTSKKISIMESRIKLYASIDKFTGLIETEFNTNATEMFTIGFQKEMEAFEQAKTLNIKGLAAELEEHVKNREPITSFPKKTDNEEEYKNITSPAQPHKIISLKDCVTKNLGAFNIVLDRVQAGLTELISIIGCDDNKANHLYEQITIIRKNHADFLSAKGWNKGGNPSAGLQ